ncbi:hypothetical protein WDU94_003691 [Cyamophila willieti]
MLGFVIRNTQEFKNIDTIKTLYNAYVRSLLETNSSVWSPQYECHIRSLEQIQHKFLHYLSYKQKIPILDHDYIEIMKKNKMINLEDRRYILDASFLLKIIKNIIDCPQLLEKIQFRINNRSTRNLDTFNVPFARTNMFANSPIIRLQKI